MDAYNVQHTALAQRTALPGWRRYLKISGGIFHDMLCHDFDMLHFLTGQVSEAFL
jgi:predicted dehydrogenase